MSDSPYRPPPPGHPTQEAESGSAIAPGSLLPFAQLGLRLLGVMLIVDGLGAMFGGLIQGLLQAQAYADAGYDVLIDPHSAGWAAGGIPHFVIGFYLTVGGTWILRNVFMSSTVHSGKEADVRESPS